jgi:hypothetical protein
MASNRPLRKALWRKRLVRLGGLALLSAAPGFGCGREFFRQWADQDVTEAVFEKSRDPRWRLPMFTIDPPAMSRFADYSDPDRPAAPPDDHATEALSPYPQKPHMRMIVPMEGTGYLDMLERGPRYTPPPPEPGRTESGTEVPPLSGDAPPPAGGQPPFGGPATGPGPDQILTPPPAGRPEERPEVRDEEEIPGTLEPPLSPNTTTPPATPENAPAGRPDTSNVPPQASSSQRDPNVLATAMVQDARPGLPGAEPGDRFVPPADAAQERPRDVSPLGGAPGAEGAEAAQERPLVPPITRPGATPEEIRQIQAGTADFAALLSRVPIDYNEALVAGLPADSRPYVINPAQALQLGLTNSRSYQFRLENVYLQSLTVTLNRFNFEPQFFAGMSPSTGVATPPGAASGSFPQGAVGVNQFTYRTREAPGGQASQLSLNTAAGWGKLFVFGGRVLAGFANTTVFNFVGSNPRQPSVQSTLPLTFIQPFLRGGGRAVTLEPLTLAERQLLYEVRSFARFRQEFLVSLLTANQPVTNPGLNDPNTGFLNLVLAFQQAENQRIIVASFERSLEIYKVYAENSGSSGISQLQVDQIDQNLNNARGALITAQQNYRNLLDQYKQQLGLPPDTPLIPDLSVIAEIRQVFRDILEWQARAGHDPSELPGIIGGLPRLQNVILDGRPMYDYSTDPPRPIYADPERLEEFLIVAERVALENRLDLMNQRATLYDVWRQIAVQANSLLPFFNVQVNYQLLTPANTTNPFGFNDQSNQFNMSLNTELPLVRLNERNNFRTALLNYQRGRRTLMQFEDSVKFQVRQEIRALINFGENYDISRTVLINVLRQRDQALQQLIAPPEQVGGGFNPNILAQQATQTINYINSVNGVLAQLNTLVNNWVQYQTQRLALYRDLGIMPFDEWEAYYELFPAGASRTAPRGRGDAGRPVPDAGPAALGPAAGRGA